MSDRNKAYAHCECGQLVRCGKLDDIALTMAKATGYAGGCPDCRRVVTITISPPVIVEAAPLITKG